MRVLRTVVLLRVAVAAVILAADRRNRVREGLRVAAKVVSNEIGKEVD